jgi:NTE family protein
MKTAFVFSGGASLGAVEVGMAIALAEAGRRPDFIVGTSAGALNGAFLAGRSWPDAPLALATLWREIKREDVFPFDARGGLLGLIGRRDHLIENGPLRALIERNLTYAKLEEAPIPMHVVATDVSSGGDRLLSTGDALEAVLASAAIPGVFAPIEIDGHRYMDGGVTANTPIGHAVTLGADVVYVLPTGHACASEATPRGALGMVLQAITVLIGRQLVIDIERFGSVVDLRVVPTLCPLEVQPIDFDHSDELIERALASTRAWIAAGEPDDGQEHLRGHP